MPPRFPNLRLGRLRLAARGRGGDSPQPRLGLQTPCGPRAVSGHLRVDRPPHRRLSGRVGSGPMTPSLGHLSEGPSLNEVVF